MMDGMSDATPDVPKPDWGSFKDAWAELGKAIESVGHVIAAQGALGYMLNGDLANARETLANLPADQLQSVSVAAAALSSLADEIAAETG